MIQNYGGKGHFQLPSYHKAGMRVPKGGSSCSNCKYVSEDLKHCSNKYFQMWNDSDELPYLANEYCSDFYEPKIILE